MTISAFQPLIRSADFKLLAWCDRDLRIRIVRIAAKENVYAGTVEDNDKTAIDWKDCSALNVGPDDRADCQNANCKCLLIRSAQ